MTSTGTDGVDLRVGDRIAVLPDRARSAHTRAVLIRGFAIEVTSLHADFEGAIEVTGILLTTRGAWRAGMPTRSVILTPEAYTTPIRVGDTVGYPITGETPVVTAIHQRFDGSAVGDLLFRYGDTATGVNLVDLAHLERAATLPAVQACKRRHDLHRLCRRCAEATEHVGIGCGAALCSRTAINLVVWSPPAGRAQTKALCHSDTEQLVAMAGASAAVRVIRLADGTLTYVDDGSGTQVATCRGCGHAIYLYPALLGRQEPWRDGVYDETGRCSAAEDRRDIRVVHEPAITVAERDYARAAAICGTAADLHPLTDCPAHRA
jgi:hypothetical protein